MSTQANCKTALKTALTAVTWTIPTSAANVENAKATAFARIDTQQFGDQVSATEMPYVRIHIPDVHNHTMTQGSDLGAIKRRDYTAFLFIYWGTWVKNWQGGGDYFDNICDAVQDYFNAHRSAPGQSGIGVGQPAILGWNLKSDARIELPDRYEEYIYYRATIGVDVVEVII